MIGHVILGALAGLTGGSVHLATGGSFLGALGTYAGVGTVSILLLATYTVFVTADVGGHASRSRPRHGRMAGIRAGRPSLPHARSTPRRTVGVARQARRKTVENQG